MFESCPVIRVSRASDCASRVESTAASDEEIEAVCEAIALPTEVERLLTIEVTLVVA
jgi:hypothetical protein